ncbi:MAG: STAS domain-containing protein [Gallionellaceae bacterium]|nr:STAS domain-containing protein [Gallionellaceae bacterium]
MQISSNKSSAEDKVVLQLTGRFDFSARHIFKEAYTPLLQPSPEKIIEINMAGVDYLDSSSLGMLMLLSEKASEVGKSISLTQPNTTVAQILDIANIGKVPNIKIIK